MIDQGVLQHAVEPTRQFLPVVHRFDRAHRLHQAILQHVVRVGLVAQPRDEKRAELSAFREDRIKGAAGFHKQK